MFATMIENDPGLLHEVRIHLLKNISSNPGSFIQLQWSRLLRRPWNEIREQVLACDEQGYQLRRESPLCSMLWHAGTPQ